MSQVIDRPTTTDATTNGELPEHIAQAARLINRQMLLDDGAITQDLSNELADVALRIAEFWSVSQKAFGVDDIGGLVEAVPAVVFFDIGKKPVVVLVDGLNRTDTHPDDATPKVMDAVLITT